MEGYAWPTPLGVALPPAACSELAQASGENHHRGALKLASQDTKLQAEDGDRCTFLALWPDLPMAVNLRPPLAN